MNGAERIMAERRRQIESEGWTPEHDAEHTGGELAIAGASYAVAEDLRLHYKDNSIPPGFWPWDEAWWKPSPENRVRELEKAGALIAAEIDRLLREKGESPSYD